MISTVLLKHGKNEWIAVYVPKETILKEMAAKIKLSLHFFFDLVWELSNKPCIIKGTVSRRQAIHHSAIVKTTVINKMDRM
jgi:hypothetical protein